MSDASEWAWGACKIDPNSSQIHREMRTLQQTGGFWDEDLSKAHITQQETRAACNTVMSLALPGERVRLLADATTTVAAFNKWGSNRSRAVNQEMKNFYNWSLEKKVEVTACYVQGEKNPADRPSRRRKDHNDYHLNRLVWLNIMKVFRVRPTVDLFASE